MEMHEDVACLTAKTDRLISDVSGLSAKVGGVEDKVGGKIGALETALTWATGFGVAAMLLIPPCAAIMWWSFGSKIEQMRDDLPGTKKPSAVTGHSPPNR
jgi:hypothetical protein